MYISPLYPFAAREQGSCAFRKSDASEIGHGVRLDPHDVVEKPIAQVLHDRTDPINIVIGTDHPYRPHIF